LNSESSLARGRSEVGGVDKSGSNAGVRLTDEQAAPPSSSRDYSFLLLFVPALTVGFLAGIFVSYVFRIVVVAGCQR